MTRKHLLIGVISLCIQACAVPIDDIATPIEIPEKFSRTGKLARAQHWWQAFNDPQLNQLIDTALSNNFSLLSAYNRLQQAQALAKKSNAKLIPSINALFSGQQNYRDSADNSQFSLGLNASYEVDLWGRIRANNNAADLDVLAVQESLNTAAISLSAEVAIAWYRLIEQRSQLALLQQQIKTNQNNVALITSRFAGGQARAADVFQQQQTLAARVGDQSNVRASIKILEHQLAVLTGHTPNTLTLPEQNLLPELPPQPQTGLSSELIQRRPDLRTAYYRVQAADQRTASAIADRFPKLSLSASIDTTAPNLQSLFNNWIGTLAGNLVLPIVDGGRRIAEVDRNQAVAAEALNNYASALQRALQEVENALAQEQQQQLLVISLDKQHRLSEQATLQIRLLYMYGSMDFLRVLTTQISQQSLERSQILARRQLLEYRIQLYRALAGSWQLKTLAINKDNTDA